MCKTGLEPSVKGNGGEGAAAVAMPAVVDALPAGPVAAFVAYPAANVDDEIMALWLVVAEKEESWMSEDPLGLRGGRFADALLARGFR